MKSSRLNNQKRMFYFIVIAVSTLSVLTGAKLVFSYHSTVKSAEITLAKQYTDIALVIAKGMDKEEYKQFLLAKTNDEHYENIRGYLEEYRERINALYVYTLLLDDSEVSKVMVSAFPPEVDDMPIGSPCTVPPEQVRLAKQAENYYTDVIHDEHTGSYMSIGVPIFDDNGDMLGMVGIDIAAEDLGYISKHVIKNNLFIYGMDILFAFVLLAGVYLLNKWYKARLKRDLQESEKIYISELGKIVDTIKSSRHDLMNHLQVLNGLMDLKMYNKAHDYLKQLTLESKTLNLSLSIKNPILMVLFQSKWERAHSKNIQMIYETDFHAFDRISSMDLAKLLSNLLDNAIEAVEENESDLPKVIRVYCTVEKGKYIFTVVNPAVLSEEEQSSIFQQGFTTKGEDQSWRGTGLSIVKRTVEKYNGQIHFEYENSNVLIRITI
ncbi:GHKL domain-containing protein [Paenibacillus paridis]|uniref:GHKL domain-containing protein n=1 Tax=Paenibacillus paridis TaxID=2583376 RepID=UPI00111F4FCF|nr:GHKL domain-containing protein [Paenibacillus paridis]